MKRRLVILAAVLALAALLWVVRELYRPYRGYSGSQLVVIEPGTHATAVAGLMVASGVLAHRLPFLCRYWIGRPRHSLKAGDYLFDRPLRPVDVYRRLIQGDVYLHPVTIPEGSDRFDIGRILQQRLGLNAAEFLRATEQTAPIKDLDPQAPTLEGYLFPDTYRFARGVSATNVVATMVARFRRVLESKFRAELPPSSPRLHDLITLASLVEKETPEPSERPLVAGVFVRRLEKGMPLQCDPTVVYAAHLSHRPIGPITEGDLDFDSPYNTYRYAGLPPGPIANPGEASIRAALHPGAGQALYFVSNNHGAHVFARTLAEHQRNVSRYRKGVAALRQNVGEKVAQSSPAGSAGAKRAATSRSANDGQGAKQKADHSRLLPDAESRPHRKRGNPSDRARTPPASRREP